MSLRLLPLQWQVSLQSVPERGRGYHRVTITFSDTTVIEDVIVHHGRYADLPPHKVLSHILDVRPFHPSGR